MEGELLYLFHFKKKTYLDHPQVLTLALEYWTVNGNWKHENSATAAIIQSLPSSQDTSTRPQTGARLIIEILNNAITKKKIKLQTPTRRVPRPPSESAHQLPQ